MTRSDRALMLPLLAVAVCVFVLTWNTDLPRQQGRQTEPPGTGTASVSVPSVLPQSTQGSVQLSPVAATDEELGPQSSVDARITAAQIAGLVALIVAIGQIIASAFIATVNQRGQESIKRRELSHATAWDVAKTALDFKFRQLNDLYGPALALSDQSRMLAGRLKTGKPIGWHLLANIEETLKNRTERMIVQQILRANMRLGRVLVRHAGMVMPDASGELPKCIAEFLNHIALIELAVKKGNSLPDVGPFDVYPSGLDDHLRQSRDMLWTQLNETLQKQSKQLDELLGEPVTR